MHRNLYPLCFLLALAASLPAQVVVNEFSAANLDGITDNYGEREDWVELYNAGSSAVNLTGYFLSDDIDDPGKWAFPNGVSIAPGGYLLVFADDRDEFDGFNVHAGFKITQTQQEYVVLSDPQINLLDAVQIAKPNQANHSRGRSSDGAAEFALFLNPSPGAPNYSPQFEYEVKPQMSEAAGFYTAPVAVGIIAELGSTIRYTLDGSEPTLSSPLYTNPLTISQTTVLKAKAWSGLSDVPPSFTEANTYFINEDHTVPVLSIAGDDIAALMNGDQFAPRTSFEYFDNGELIDEAYGECNKHGNDSWAYEQRGIDYITRDQMGYKSSIGHQIFPNKDRNNFQRLIIKAAANDNYPSSGGAHIRDAYVHRLSQNADMEMDERSYEPCILYVNGQYWGVYELREKVDDADFTRTYYDQGEKWIDYIKTWGGTWEEYGSRDDWDVLHNFITTSDMSVQANYDEAKSKLNMLSLIDYMILNTHVVCKDWLNWNTSWWRGRKPDGGALQWRYTLWDMDATFGHYINYTGIPDVSANADPCYAEDLPADFEGHGALIEALMANEEFHSLYVNRYADMNNSFFTCAYMQSLLDSLIGAIAPEMPRHIQTWGGSVAEWEANIQTLRDFIDTRCTVINSGIEDCYDVTGPFPVTVQVEPAGEPNRVQVNTFIPGAFPFTGSYFQGTTLHFAAVPDPDWELDHWEVQNNTFAPDQFAYAISLALADTLGDVVTAVFRPAVPCADAYNFTFDSTLASISAGWEGPSNTISYELGYRKSGSGEDWTTFSLTDPAYTIYGLDLCTDYDIRVRSICDFALGSYLEFVKKTACLNGSQEAQAGVFEWGVFPNPVAEQATVDFILAEKTDVAVQVATLAGQVLLSKDLGEMAAGQHRFSLPAAEWSSGAYLVRLLTREGTVVKKVVKG